MMSKKGKRLARTSKLFSSVPDFTRFIAEFNARTEGENERGQSHRSRKLTGADDLSIADSGHSPNNSLTPSDVAKFKDQVQRKRLSSFWSSFSKGQEKEDLLRSQLETWSANGLPAMPDLITLGRTQFETDIFHIAGQWQEVVKSTHLSKRERDQQERVWELLKTEVKYIRRLAVIKDLFMCCLINLQNEGVLNEIDSERVFSNILDVHEGNALLWRDHMREVIRRSSVDGSLLNPSFMTAGFQKISELLHPYTKYCLEQEACREYVKTKCQENELFRIFVSWCEAQKQCNRLKLADLMVTPMHRLTRYKLLLDAIIKYTDDETQKQDLHTMVDKVGSFAKEVDNAMRQKQEMSRLSRIIHRIESYEAVEAPNEECAKLVAQYNKLDLTWPMQGCSTHQRRQLIKEGPLKLRDTNIKTDVYVFLFTDMLLLTKGKEKKSEKVKVIKPPMRLDHVLVHPLRDGTSFLLVHLNEFNMASAVHTLHGDCRAWVDNITKAQEDYRKLWTEQWDRNESALMCLNLSDDEDEAGEMDPQPNYLSRTESINSDVFMPRVQVPRVSHQQAIDESAEANFTPRPRSATFSADDARPVQHPPLQTRRSEPDILLHKRTLVVEGNSVLLDEALAPSLSPAPLGDSMIESPGPRGPDATSTPHSGQLTRNGSASSSGESTPGSSQGEGHLPGRPDLFLEENRVKLANRRKSGAEKRYYTADYIQDIQRKDKDSSIQKRYSLNFGANDAEISINRQTTELQTFSSDSLRSMPSSSGVSSTGSLHMNAETDIYEDREGEDEAGSDSPSRESNSPNNLAPLSQTPKTAPPSGTSDISNLSPVSLKKLSKSYPDLVIKCGAKNGPQLSDLLAEGEKKKLSHSEIRKLTKQLLLNSTLEATEV